LRKRLPRPPRESGAAAARESARPAAFGIARRAAWTWAVAFAAVTALPYLIAAAAAPAGHAYTWILPPYSEDGLAYFAWVRQAELGHLLFAMKYTAVPHQPFLFLPFFLVAGWIVHLTALPVGIAMLLLKSVGVVLFWLAFFRLAATLRLDRRETLLGAVLAGTSSGLGGWWALFAGLERATAGPAADLRIVDANTLWSLVWNPLFPFSFALMLLAFDGWERATADGREMRGAWIAGAALGGLALVHPYVVPLLLVVLGVVGAARLRAGVVPAALRLAAGLALPAGITAYSYFSNPLVQAHSRAGTMQAGPLTGMLLALGLPLLLAGIGMAAGRGDVRRRLWPLALWAALGLAGCTLPVWFQHKMVLGVHLPVCMIAAAAVASFQRPSGGRGRHRAGALAAVALLVAATVPSHVANAIATIRDVRRNDACHVYVREDVAAALGFLRRSTSPDDVVLASLTTSTLVPAFAGNTVVWGHWAQSVDIASRRRWLLEVVVGSRSPLTEGERLGRLREGRVRYVVTGSECRLDDGLGPLGWLRPYLRTAFSSGPVAVLELIDAPGRG
jgi:hypothetical protein